MIRPSQRSPLSLSSSSFRKQLWTVIGIGLLLMATMVLQSLKLQASVTASYDDEPMIRVPTLVETNRRPSMARDIVERSFHSSFVHLTSKCPATNNASNTTTTPIVKCCQEESYPNTPWWFQTMMRDFQWTSSWHTQSAYHVLPPSPNNSNARHNTTYDGALQMCSFEKVGIKHWKELFCVFQNKTSLFGQLQPCHPEPQVPPTTPKFVFLRDPLERFLSAFIDKCIRPLNTTVFDEHCEPSMIFTNPNNTGRFLGPQLQKDKRALFEAFVSATPLKWNIHFFPQSLYCDGLYRNLDTYDFIGHMDSNFYVDLQRLGQRYGETFYRGLDKVFDLSTKLQTQQQLSLSSNNNTNATTEGGATTFNKGIETLASTHVLEYYSPRTVRQVLEYMAIDYALLELPIPTWAEQMLLLEEKQEKNLQ